MLEAHRGACVYCGAEPVDQRTLTRDHLTPRARQGANALFNIVPACADCNVAKGDMPLARFVRKHQRTRGFILRWADALWRLFGADVDVVDQLRYAHAFAKALAIPGTEIAVERLAAMLAAASAPVDVSGGWTIGAPTELRDALSARLSADEAKREKAQKKRRRRAEQRRRDREAYEAALLRWVMTRRNRLPTPEEG